MQTGNWAQALDLWTKCIQDFDNGEQPWWHSALADVLLEMDRVDEAGRILEQLILDHPDYPPGRLGLAKLAQKRGNWEQAAVQWETCIRRFDGGKQPWWLAQYAHALIKLEKFLEARCVLEKLTLDHPDFPNAHVELAALALRQRDWALAANSWETCIHRFDDGTQCGWYKHYAHALMGMEKYVEAVAIYLRIEQAGETDAGCLHNLAKASYLSKQMDNCLHYAGRLIAEHPELPEGYYWSEQALIKVGRFKEAADYHLARPDNKTEPDPIPERPSNYPRELVLPNIPGNGNDYDFIEEKLHTFEAGNSAYHLPVSIVIPVYNRANILAKTLAALTHQSYPQHLIEVMIADDGSNDDIGQVVEKYRRLLDISYVRQEDRGHRVAAVRNLGIRAASHDHIILLDCDVMPSYRLIAAHMKYFHVSDRVVLLGIRSYVSAHGCSDDDLLAHPELIEQLPRILPSDEVSNVQTMDGRAVDLRVPILARTRDLKDALFPCVQFVGCNVAFPKSAFEAAGCFDEDFQDWGGEDTEFGYRLYNCGYYFIPITAAIGLHQEPSPEQGDHQADRFAGSQRTQPILEQKYPLFPGRLQDSNAVYAVPKVSIYIPVYNTEVFIKEAVDSALNQTYTDLEVVICNDGSTDGTLSVLEQNYSDNPRVRWISQPNRGIAAATNKAVGACRGMYIGQLDADDILEITAVASMVKLLDKKNIGMAYGHECRIDRHGKVMSINPSVGFSRELLMVSMICTHFRMFRKRDWSRISGCDESLENAVDYDLALKFSEICSIGYLPELTYRYRFHGSNTSLVNRNAQERNHVIAINKALARMDLSNAWRAVEGPETDRRRVRFDRLEPISHDPLPALEKAIFLFD